MGRVRCHVDKAIIGPVRTCAVLGRPKVPAGPAVFGHFQDPLGHKHGVHILDGLDARPQAGVVLGHEVFHLADIRAAQVRGDNVVQACGLGRHHVDVVQDISVCSIARARTRIGVIVDNEEIGYNAGGFRGGQHGRHPVVVIRRKGR